MTEKELPKESQHAIIEAIYNIDMTIRDLEMVEEESKKLAWECYDAGAYASARRFMASASMARQLLTYKREAGEPHK